MEMLDTSVVHCVRLSVWCMTQPANLIKEHLITDDKQFIGRSLNCILMEVLLDPFYRMGIR